MTSSYNDSVMSFDLGYLQQPSSNINISNLLKCRKNIARVKSRILNLNAVIEKCTEQSEIIESTSKSLFASKEECKQLCIDHKNVLEKCENLENDIKTLQLHNQQLHHKLTDAENQYSGMQSMAKQLEVLAREREIQIESLTVENNLEKANSKKFASRATSLQKRNERLFRDVCKLGKFLIGKERLPASIQETLNRYSKHLKDDDDDSCHDSSGDHSDNEIGVLENNLKTSQSPHHITKSSHDIIMSPHNITESPYDITESPHDITKSPHDINRTEGQSSSIEMQEMIVVNLNSTEKETSSNYKLDEMDRYSDCSNEIASADTGRGSSLEFSDSEKCFLSPDSFQIENHGSPEIITKTTKGTSPKRVVETTDIATSPIRIETPSIPLITIDKAIGPDEPINNENEPCDANSYASEMRSSETMIDESIQDDTNTQEVQFTDIQDKELLQVNSSPTIIDESIQDDTNAQEVQFTGIQDKQFLQVNSNNHYSDEDNSGNYEVEMILKKMKFNRELITPIPSSPSNSRCSVITEVSGSQTDQSVLTTMFKQVQILVANQSKIIKAVVSLKEENKNSILNQADKDNSRNEKILNIEKDISELNQLPLFRNIDVQEESEQTPNDNYDSEEIRITYDKNNNGNETEKSQHGDCEESIQLQNENEPEPDDLMEMTDLIQTCPTKSMSLNEFSISNSPELTIHEEIADSLQLNRQDESPINMIDEQENSSEKLIGRLEFEEDAICTSPSQPLDLNNEILETSENIAGDIYPPPTKPVHCNDRIRRKMRKLNHLEKLRRKMVPKCKIQREKLLAKKPRVTKHIGDCIRRSNVKLPKKKITVADSSASLNDKAVYDNAVRIMSEFKSKRSKETIHKSVLKLTRVKKAKNIRLLKPKHSEIPHKPAKTQSATTDLSVEKLTTVSNEKPFDIADLMSKLTQKPIIKSLLTTNTQNKLIVKNNCIDLSKLENNQSLKLMQPVILVDRLQEKRDFGREIQYDKTSHSSNINTSKSSSPNINTRSRGRGVEKPPPVNVNLSTAEETSPKDSRKRLKRISCDDNQDIEHKRVLRSSTRQSNVDESHNGEIISDNLVDISNKDSTCSRSPKLRKCSDDTKNSSFDNKVATLNKTKEHNTSITYDDLDMFDETEITKPESRDVVHDDNPKNSILCTMLEKYSLSKVNFFPKKIPDNVTNTIVKLIEENLELISKLPSSETRKAMDDFVEKLQAWKWKDFTAAFMKYLQDPQRKVELYSKVISPPAPPMTKYEQILLYIIIKLKSVCSEVDIVDSILCQMEYILFRINQTPEFDVIESMSHFYATICRCFGMKIRLRSFMLDAMYCLQFKAIALVKQCIDVWMHVIPLAHMGIAKNPLVTCLVYLLHFYKCEDHFKRVQDIRNILHWKYFYQMSDWNEKRILEVVRNAIFEVIEKPEEKKILRRSLLVLAKRQGPRWCQKNIIMNMLLPIIDNKTTPENVKLFCIWMLGPLMKPYPPDMKVHCEIVMNSLLDIAKQKPPPTTQEAVYCSLIYMSKHNRTRVINALLSWHPKHKVSPECYAVLRDFVSEKPAYAWRKALSEAYMVDEGEVGRSEDKSERN